ncbi:hypothetical protein [Pseudomonas iridis]|uniref:hypothetical protein n=1 Tax=Pseudomonas iridis TaxID=2710587 RepID=UPI001B31F7E7|nr:hypothetical protein [Pseudomonas iridis]MBP5971043.1 hypothetical protein [Pseudomonas iridis]
MATTDAWRSWSSLVISQKLEQRFGLIGLARLLKLVELVGPWLPAEGPLTVVLAWGDFLTALHCNQETATEFLAYCDHARVLDQATDEGRLRLTLVGELASRLRPPVVATPVQAGGRVLFDTDKQWVAWFKDDLNCPPYLANDPASRQLFRRWCASNVTVDEIEAACERALKAGEAPHPAVLHDHMKVIRQAKIDRAVG